jgi:hypothetical protein
MMKTLTQVAAMAVVALVIGIVLCSGSAQAIEITWPEPNWPEIFEPNQLLTLNLQIDPCDWAFIVREVSPTVDPKTYTYFPAWFWLDGEDANKIVVAVRKKSCVTIPEPNYTIPGDANLIDPNKVKISIKIDINKYYCADPCSPDCNLDDYDPNAATEWHALKKVSLENGGTTSVVAEGLACNIHSMASAPEGYDYDCWRASWVKLYVNGDYKGVYVNNEQIDKQFMRHRDLYVSHLTWLYKSWGSGALELKVGDDDFPMSPTYQALCYRPFPCLDPNSLIYLSACSMPNDVNIQNDMNSMVNMKGMLSTGGINSFLSNHDALWGANGHNFYMLDFDDGSGRKRMYFPWDVDGCFAATDYDVYEVDAATATSFAGVILGHPTFRSQYNQILKGVLDPNGPLSEANIYALIDDINTPELQAAVAADPWNQVGGDVAAECDALKTWFSARIPNVLAQIELDEPELPGTILLDDGFDHYTDGDPWDENWDEISHNWVTSSDEYAHGRPSAAAVWYKSDPNIGDFTCDALDTNDATAIHIDFKLLKSSLDVGEDLFLYYYDGTTYNLITDLETFGADNEWLHYTDTITDSNYFVPNFRIRFNATPERNEDVFIDDVKISKEVPAAPIISGTILDPGAAPVTGVSVDADNGGGSDTTDPNGDYSLTVPYDWSGTVTPTKTDYTFAPTERVYSNVTADQSAQDYTGTHVCDLYPDGIFDLKDVDVVCENWLTAGPDGDIDNSAFVDLGDFALLADMF